VGFDAAAYNGSGGTVSVSIVYDFTVFAMFGGGIDVIYDSTVLEFVSYTQADLPIDARPEASPVGMLTAEGTYTGAGIGTFEFFSGMTSAGTIGTFVFNIVGVGDFDTPCGATLCLEVNAINPFVSLAGADVSVDLLNAGVSSLSFSTVPFPVPAAVWFMLSGLGVLAGVGRKVA